MSTEKYTEEDLVLLHKLSKATHRNPRLKGPELTPEEKKQVAAIYRRVHGHYLGYETSDEGLFAAAVSNWHG